MQAQNVAQKGIDLLPMVSDSAAASQAASGFQDLLNAVNAVQDPLPTPAGNSSPTAPEPTGYVPAEPVDYASRRGSGSSAAGDASGQGGIWEPVASYSSAETARAHQAAAAADDGSDEPSAALSIETPIERFLRTLQEQGIDVKRMVLRPEERSRLQELLEASGFKSEVARQIMDRASDKNGNISISQLMAVLGQYTPSDGPLFTISPEDRPLLVQFLSELGLDTASVNEYLDSLPTTADGRIQVRGLGELLANAGQLTREVDLERLGSFLGRLGMSNEDIRSLLLLNTEPDGKMSPAGALEIFKAVSSRQGLASGGQSAENIGHLLQKVQVESPQLHNFDEAGMKATVNQNLKGSMPDPAPDSDLDQGLDQDLDQDAQEEFMRQAKEKLQAAGHQGEAGGRSGARSEALHNSVAQAASEAEAGAGQRGQPLDPALAAAIRAQSKGRAQGVENQTRQEAGTAGLNPGQAQAGGAPAVSGGTGVRSALPGYVARQVGAQMAQMIKHGDQVLRLSLKPPELGGVKMELSVEQSVIKASLTVDTVTAKQTLEAGLEQLRHNLAQQGFKVERIEVSVNPENQDQQQAQAGGQGAGGRGRGAAAGSGLGRGDDGDAAGMSPEAAAEALAGADTGRISLFA